MSRKKLHRAPIIVKKSPIHGYGVFAEKNIPQGEIIEECYTLLTKLTDPATKDFVFRIDDEIIGIVLGYGSLYNHSCTPNAAYHFDSLSGLMIFTAKSFIHQNEEILCSYGKDWFSKRNSLIRKIPLWRRLLLKTKRLIRAMIVFLGMICLTLGLRYLGNS